MANVEACAIGPCRVGTVQSQSARRAGCEAEEAVGIADNACGGDHERSAAVAADNDIAAVGPSRAGAVHRDQARRSAPLADVTVAAADGAAVGDRERSTTVERQSAGHGKSAADEVDRAGRDIEIVHGIHGSCDIQASCSGFCDIAWCGPIGVEHAAAVDAAVQINSAFVGDGQVVDDGVQSAVDVQCSSAGDGPGLRGADGDGGTDGDILGGSDAAGSNGQRAAFEDVSAAGDVQTVGDYGSAEVDRRASGAEHGKYFFILPRGVGAAGEGPIRAFTFHPGSGAAAPGGRSHRAGVVYGAGQPIGGVVNFKIAVRNIIIAVGAIPSAPTVFDDPVSPARE